MKCSFCKDMIKQGRGMIYAFKTGRIERFCSKKCEKNFLKLGRNPAKVKWVTKKKNI